MTSYGVFNAVSGALLRAFSTSDVSQVAIQSGAAHEVVLEGDFSNGRWSLGEDGWPVEDTDPTPISIAQVKYVARKRLEATDWKVTRHRDQVAAGEPPSLTEAEFEALLVERQAIRAASNAIEQMTPIPADFWQDQFWSAS